MSNVSCWLLKVFEAVLMKHCCPSLQDGLLSSRAVSESLQISEGEPDTGDSGSKLDFSGDSPSRPNSDIADVSLPLAFPWQVLGVCCPG